MHSLLGSYGFLGDYLEFLLIKLENLHTKNCNLRRNKDSGRTAPVPFAFDSISFFLEVKAES
jgi:hypothetical protein